MGNGIVEGYFDGNTVTALWNYAQNFAMNDNFYGTTFGPSTPGVLNLVAGNTYPATPALMTRQDREPTAASRARLSATLIPPVMSAQVRLTFRWAGRTSATC